MVFILLFHAHLRRWICLGMWFGDVWACVGVVRYRRISQTWVELNNCKNRCFFFFLGGGWVNTMVFRRCLKPPSCLYIALYPHSIQSPKMIKQIPQIVNFSPWLLAYAHISLYPSCPLMIHRVFIMFPFYGSKLVACIPCIQRGFLVVFKGSTGGRDFYVLYG